MSFVDVRFIVHDVSEADGRELVADFLTNALEGRHELVLPLAVVDGFLKEAQ